SFAQLMGGIGGQGLVLDDETGDLYFAQPGEGFYRIPQAREGICNQGGKLCPLIMAAGAPAEDPKIPGCGGTMLKLSGSYALALAGGILYVSGQNSQNVLRAPLRADNVLGLDLCTEEPFKNGDGGILLDTPRAIAADDGGNLYVAGVRTDNLVWVRPGRADSPRVTPQEIVSRANALFQPFAVAIDAQRNVLVSGNASSNVFRVRTV